MILVIGVTGRLGQAVAERLLAGGIPFIGACRDVTKAQSLLQRGVEIVPFDLRDTSSLADAFIGTTQVISCIHGLLGASKASIEMTDILGQMALIDAAAREGAKRFVFVSALGASPDHPSEFWRAKAAAENHLKSSGLAYVILRPSAFMDLHAHELLGSPVIRKKPVIILGNGMMARNMIAVDDVAAVAVAALVRGDLENKTIEIGGWESLTEREVAAIYEDASGNRARVLAVPPVVLRIFSKLISPFHAGIGRLLRLPLDLNGREDLHLDPSEWTKQLGINPVRLREFANQRIKGPN